MQLMMEDKHEENIGSFGDRRRGWRGHGDGSGPG
jgi:hypothetical protein